MHGRSAIWFSLALLALLAALTFWIERTVQPPQPKRDGSSRHDPDYTVSNFVMNKADRDGNPRNTLAAVSMVHFPDDDSTELVRPRYTQYSLRKPAIQIQGQRGQVTSNGENVYFMDNVKVVREATATKGQLTVLTEFMHIIPDQEIARTDRFVRILQAPHTVATGTGMEMNNKLHIFKLFHNVHVRYEPPGTAAGKPVSAPAIVPKTTKPALPTKLPARLSAPTPQVAAQKPKGAAPQLQPSVQQKSVQQKKGSIQKQPQKSLKKSTKKTVKEAVKKPVKKTRNGKPQSKSQSKPQTGKTSPATEKSNTRIRRHYETSTQR